MNTTAWISEMIVRSNHRSAFVGLGVEKSVFQKRCRASLTDFIRQITVGEPAEQQLSTGSTFPLARE